MMKNALYLCMLAFSVLTVSCTKPDPEKPSVPQGGEESTVPQPEIVLPEPPSAVNGKNLIYVDCFTNLDHHVHFAEEDIAAVKQHISQSVAERPVLCLIEGMEYKVGGPHSLVQLSHELGHQAYFAQSGLPAATTYGTGILTPYQVSVYDGAVTSDFRFMSGCQLTLPLSTVSDVLLYTTYIEKVSQLQELVKLRGEKLHKNGVLIATVPSAAVDEMKIYVEKKAGCRFYALDRGKDFELVLVMPVDFAFRGFVSGIEAGKLEYYHLKIEKLK